MICIFLPVFALAVSCDKMLLTEEQPDNPVSNFEVLWKEFDEKYALFGIKDIDWDEQYAVHRPQLESNSTDEALYAVLCSMLDRLNDNHVGLLPTNPELPLYMSGIMGEMDSITDFDLEIIRENYLSESGFEDPFFTYGYVTPDIGYIYIEGVSDMPGNLRKPMENLMERFRDSRALILDVRGGWGGEDLASQFIAGHFTQDRQLFMKTRIKDGPAENDYTDWEEWYVEPKGGIPYTRPVVVLTNRFTISAKEVFCLAMRKLPHVTFVGDTTAGSFSNQINRELPNGWGYSISIGQWVDEQENSYEGKGLAPGITVSNKKQDVLNGVDQALEQAIALLK